MRLNRILVSGSSGMVASDLFPVFMNAQKDIIGLDKLDGNIDGDICLDIRDRNGLSKVFSDFKPDVVVHLAAETDVDHCEIHREEALEVNVQGTQNLHERVKIIPVDSSYFPFVAARPQFECLIDNKLKALKIGIMPLWKNSLKNYLETYEAWNT